jgi:deoxynucleoside triphosphate triphosphohydrolase SAMHD1
MLHNTAKAIEYMIIDGLLAAEPHLGIAKRVFDPKQYLFLTDDIMPRIEDSTDPVRLPIPTITL